jgi:hypothetical protein
MIWQRPNNADRPCCGLEGTAGKARGEPGMLNLRGSLPRREIHRTLSLGLKHHMGKFTALGKPLVALPGDVSHVGPQFDELTKWLFPICILLR